jgi:hypothetical protein
MDRVHGSWSTAALAHGGPGTEATVAHHEVGKTKKSSPGFGFDLHQSLYGGKEAVRRRWTFGSRWRWRGHDGDQEEES